MENKLKQQYIDTFNELKSINEDAKTWEDCSVDEFKLLVAKFWSGSDIWKRAKEREIYSEEKLNQDFELLRTLAKRLLL